MAMAAALIAGVVVLGGLTLAVTAYVLRTRCVARHWSAKLFFGMTSSSETAHTFGSGPDVELQTRQPWDDLAEHIRLLADHLPRETRRLKELVDMNGVDSIRRQILAGLLLVNPPRIPHTAHTVGSTSPESQGETRFSSIDGSHEGPHCYPIAGLHRGRRGPQT